MNPLEIDKLEALAGDEATLKALDKLFTETIKEAEPKVEGEDDTLLGQKFRGYEKSKEILQSAFIKLLNYKRSQTLKENLNKAR